jgi:hypothetical protein
MSTDVAPEEVEAGLASVKAGTDGKLYDITGQHSYTYVYSAVRESCPANGLLFRAGDILQVLAVDHLEFCWIVMDQHHEIGCRVSYSSPNAALRRSYNRCVQAHVRGSIFDGRGKARIDYSNSSADVAVRA